MSVAQLSDPVYSLGVGISHTAHNIDGVSAGNGITVTPATGLGNVTVANTGVLTVASANAGITVSAPSGDVVVTNSGLTKLIAGNGMTQNAQTGAVTLNIGNGSADATFLVLNTKKPAPTYPVTTGSTTLITGTQPLTNGLSYYACFSGLLSWNCPQSQVANDRFLFEVGSAGGFGGNNFMQYDFFPANVNIGSSLPFLITGIVKGFGSPMKMDYSATVSGDPSVYTITVTDASYYPV